MWIVSKECLCCWKEAFTLHKDSSAVRHCACKGFGEDRTVHFFTTSSTLFRSQKPRCTLHSNSFSTASSFTEHHHTSSTIFDHASISASTPCRISRFLSKRFLGLERFHSCPHLHCWHRHDQLCPHAFCPRPESPYRCEVQNGMKKVQEVDQCSLMFATRLTELLCTGHK